MNQFKLFLKILRSRRTNILIYLVIFLVIFLLATDANQKSGNIEGNSRLVLNLVDLDRSPLSKALVKEIGAKNEIADSEEDAGIVRDRIFQERYSMSLVIPKGFGEAFPQSKKSLLLQPSVKESENQILKGQIQSFLMKADALGRFSSGPLTDKEQEELLDFLADNKTPDPSVELISATGDSQLISLGEYLSYLDYIIVAILFLIIGPATSTMERPLQKSRDLISGVTERERSRTLFLSVSLSGLVVWIFMILVCLGIIGFSVLSISQARWMLLSNFLHLLATTSMILFLVQFVQSPQAINFVSTIFSLFIAFSSGIFIPAELVWNPLYQFSHIFPSVWDIRLQNGLVYGSIPPSIQNGELVQGLCIQLGMAVLFFLLMLIYRRSKNHYAWIPVKQNQ